MKALWKQWSARFAALQEREKYLIAGAVLVVVLFGGYNFWMEPAQLSERALRTQLVQQRTDLAQLQIQVAGMQHQITDPDAANRHAIADVQQAIDQIDQQLTPYDKVLVAPGQMAELLRTMLARHRGLELVSLKTLDPMPVIEHAPPAGTVATAAAAQDSDAGGNIYRHGIEIKMAGSYADLESYVAELEHASRHLLLGRMTLSVSRYPRVELTLTVYSLSLDRRWLVV